MAAAQNSTMIFQEGQKLTKMKILFKTELIFIMTSHPTEPRINQDPPLCPKLDPH